MVCCCMIVMGVRGEVERRFGKHDLAITNSESIRTTEQRVPNPAQAKPKEELPSQRGEREQHSRGGPLPFPPVALTRCALTGVSSASGARNWRDLGNEGASKGERGAEKGWAQRSEVRREPEERDQRSSEPTSDEVMDGGGRRMQRAWLLSGGRG